MVHVEHLSGDDVVRAAQKGLPAVLPARLVRLTDVYDRRVALPPIGSLLLDRFLSYRSGHLIRRDETADPYAAAIRASVAVNTLSGTGALIEELIGAFQLGLRHAGAQAGVTITMHCAAFTQLRAELVAAPDWDPAALAALARVGDEWVVLAEWGQRHSRESFESAAGLLLTARSGFLEASTVLELAELVEAGDPAWGVARTLAADGWNGTPAELLRACYRSTSATSDSTRGAT